MINVRRVMLLLDNYLSIACGSCRPLAVLVFWPELYLPLVVLVCWHDLLVAPGGTGVLALSTSCPWWYWCVGTIY